MPVTSPYAGRVTKVLVRAGDAVKAGDVLLTLEATDMVQAQNDYQAALNTLAKATALLKLDQTIAARQHEEVGREPALGAARHDQGNPCADRRGREYGQ